MSRCTHCQAPLVPDAAFCARCGSAQADASDRATIASPSGASRVDALGRSSAHGERFAPGFVLGERYRLIALLGRGGMGEVYRADDLKLGQAVALKFLPRELASDPERVERFLGEVRLARQVAHPNVCRVYDIGEFEGQHFLSMEYVDGEDLSSLLQRVGRLPHERAAEVARQICAGLAAAHERGILHRDLKPANVMLDGRGQVRITDFGLAGLAKHLDASDGFAGTPAYMAPELLAGGVATVQSEIYALGLLLHELYTGRAPRRGQDGSALRDSSGSADSSAPHSASTLLEPAVERVIFRCLEQDPSDRPSSVVAVALGLPGGDPLAAALAAGETPSPELVAEAGRSEALSPSWAIALALASVLLFVVAALWLGRSSVYAYLPFAASPAVYVDDARQLLERVGYTSEAYADPVDQAWGFRYSNRRIRESLQEDADDPWAALRGRGDVVGFWYRQSPRLFNVPPNTPNSFASGLVREDDPLPFHPGEVRIGLDQLRRLQQFEIWPKIFSRSGADTTAVDWAPFFAAAQLERANFHPTTPGYRPQLDPERRWAWLGVRAESTLDTLRVEAGSAGGRPIVFVVSEARAFAAADVEPQPWPTRLLDTNYAQDGILLLLLFAGALVARLNSLRGRVDLRGALRIGLAFFVTTACFEILRSHMLYTAFALQEIWNIAGTATFFGVVLFAIYLALEPFGRRVWPTMFVSTGRLLSRQRVELRDPLIGRAVLLGLLAGVVQYLIVHGVFRELAPLLGQELWWPERPDPDLFVSQRQAVAWSMWSAIRGSASAFFFAFMLVALRALTRRASVAMLLVPIAWTLVFGNGLGTLMPFFALVSALMLFVLLRGGLLALIVMQAVVMFDNYAITVDYSAWYSQAAVSCLVAVIALAIYGAWAATAQSRRVGV